MRINRARLAESMEALGKIGKTARGGLPRVAPKDDDPPGRDPLVRRMKGGGPAAGGAGPFGTGKGRSR